MDPSNRRSRPATSRPPGTRRPRKSSSATVLDRPVRSDAVPPVSPDQPALYVPFRPWLASRPGRPLTAIAVALILIQGLVRGYLKFGGWFVGDDLSFIARAERMPFLSRTYLLSGWNGHFMPGAFVLVRLLNATAYFDYTPVAIVDIALQAGLGYLVFVLLRELFGPRRAILVPLAIFLFSPITLPAFLWWAAALNQLPGQLAMAGALLLHVRYLRSGRTLTGIGGAGVVLAGLMFSEKLMIFVPVVPAMTVLYFIGGPPMQRLRVLVTRHWRVWIAYLIVVVPYAVFYVTVIPTPVNGQNAATVQGVVDTASQALGHAIIPGVFGGPWIWQPIGSFGGVADPGSMTILITSLIAVGILWLTILRNYRASFGWAIVLGYEALNVLLLGVTRARWVGPIIGAEYRYSTDACFVIVVFGACAFLPIVGTFARAEPQKLVPRTATTVSRVAAHRGRYSPQSEPVVTSVLVALIAVSSLVSTMRFDPLWRDHVNHPYFANVRADIARSPTRITIADVGINPNIQGGLSEPLNDTSYLFKGFTPHPYFLVPGASSTDLYVPDLTGHLRDADVAAVRNKPGPEVGCGYRIGARATTIPLGIKTFGGEFPARISYIADGDADTTVTAGTITTKVHIYGGTHTVFVLAESDGLSSITIHGLTDNADMCTNDVGVGLPAAIPGTHP